MGQETEKLWVFTYAKSAYSTESVLKYEFAWKKSTLQLTLLNCSQNTFLEDMGQIHLLFYESTTDVSILQIACFFFRTKFQNLPKLFSFSWKSSLSRNEVD